MQKSTYKGAMSAKIEKCVDDCLQCDKVCREAHTMCLNMGGDHAEATHISYLTTCAEACTTSADFMLANSEFYPQMCQLCAEVCDKCAQSCDKFDEDFMKNCAQICRNTAESCRKMSR